jgi:membrane protease YdiL (CAAX protease family)
MQEKAKQLVLPGIIYLLILFIMGYVPKLMILGKTIPIKIGFMLLPYLLMLGAVLLACYLEKEPIGSKLGFNKEAIGKQLLMVIPIFVLVSFLFVVGPLLIGMNLSDVLSFKVSKPGIFVFYVIFDMVFVGMGEELVFRGYFFEKLKRVFNSGIWGVILSAILFGLFHYPNGHNFAQVGITTIIGLIFGFSRLKFKNCSTLSVGIAHGLYDTFILILSSILL